MRLIGRLHFHLKVGIGIIGKNITTNALFVYTYNGFFGVNHLQCFDLDTEQTLDDSFAEIRFEPMTFAKV